MEYKDDEDKSAVIDINWGEITPDISWIKCSEQMPPDRARGKIIIRTNGKFIVTSSRVLINTPGDKSKVYWIPFDEATWKELTNVG